MPTRTTLPVRLPALLIITAFTATSACRSDERTRSIPPLSLPDPCTVLWKEKNLPAATVNRLRNFAPTLKPTTKPITTKPDLVLTVTVPGAGTQSVLSAWFDERFLYQGEYLEAWQERMTADTAAGYRINSSLEGVLRELHSSDPPEEH